MKQRILLRMTGYQLLAGMMIIWVCTGMQNEARRLRAERWQRKIRKGWLRSPGLLK